MSSDMTEREIATARCTNSYCNRVLHWPVPRLCWQCDEARCLLLEQWAREESEDHDVDQTA